VRSALSQGLGRHAIGEKKGKPQKTWKLHKSEKTDNLERKYIETIIVGDYA
jgi:hypothetical protein